MGSNAEIRKRMDTYRSILLVINWIGSVIVSIVGFVLINEIGGYAAIVIIIAVILGIIGHYLINVALAIPFIFLNNGDILETMKGNNISSSNDWICKKCNYTNRSTALFCYSCGEKK